MKIWFKAICLWLVSALVANAQPRNGPPSLTQIYGPNPASPPNVFQNAPQMTEVPGPDQGNTTPSSGGFSFGDSAPPAANPSSSTSAAATPAGGNAATAPASGNRAASGASTSPLIPTVMVNRPVSIGPDLPNVTMPTSMAMVDNERRLEKRDQIVYQVVEDREPQPHILFVNEHGDINVPYGPENFPAANLTLRELTEKLQKELTGEHGNYKHATVLAAFYHGNSRGTVNFAGEVMRPGPFPVPTSDVLTLWKALNDVGYNKETADLERVVVVHHDPEDPSKEGTKEVYNVADLIRQGKIESVVLEPGDFINVPSKGDTSGTVLITGEVPNKMYLPLPAGRPLTLSEAIIKAGGFTNWSVHTVKLIRYDKNNKKIETDVDVDEVLKYGNKDKDVNLQPGDTVVVPASFFSFGF